MEYNHVSRELRRLGTRHEGSYYWSPVQTYGTGKMENSDWAGNESDRIPARVAPMAPKPASPQAP